jgi:hypothetical protein
LHLVHNDGRSIQRGSIATLPQPYKAPFQDRSINLPVIGFRESDTTCVQASLGKDPASWYDEHHQKGEAMPSNRNHGENAVNKRSRTTKEQADQQGIGEPEEGVRLPVPGYAEDDQASFLGVDEPVVPEDERGSPPPPPSLPRKSEDH